MKELTNIKFDIENDRTEISIKKKQKTEYVLEGIFKPAPGHKIWEVNTISMEIKEADYRKDTAIYLHAKKMPENLTQKADCIYIPALNIKNAKEKFNKNKNQSHYYAKKPPMNLKELFT